MLSFHMSANDIYRIHVLFFLVENLLRSMLKNISWVVLGAYNQNELKSQEDEMT